MPGWNTTRPAFFSPMRAMKNPIPTLMAHFRPRGIALTTASRSRVSVRPRKTAPETKTAARAACHDRPRESTTVYVKKAFSPMPGARAKG